MIDVEALKERLSIEEVFDFLGLAWPMRRSMRCPFHDDRTPSFYLYPQTDSWYCFGCNQGGDIIQLVMADKSCTFIKAVRELAQLAGVPDDGKPQSPMGHPMSSRELHETVSWHAHQEIAELVRKQKMDIEQGERIFEEYDEIEAALRNEEVELKEATKRLLEWRLKWKGRL